MNCRFCQSHLRQEFIDLVNSPPSNSFLPSKALNAPETFYPLRLFVCENCFLVQIDEYKKAQEIFDADYLYFASFSKSWLSHCKKYTEHICSYLGLGNQSLVVEIASNDGYLLQYFKEKQIATLGIEPTAGTARVAIEKGIETRVEYFGKELALQLREEGKKADLLIGNNVLAHVPDLNDFIAGLKLLLKEEGIITMEFPHLLNLVAENQFDTIYHEHFSYLSLYTTRSLFEAHGLSIFHVEEIPTHGGSLRIYVRHQEDSKHKEETSVQKVLEKELALGMNTLPYYQGFQQKANKVKLDLLEFLVAQKKQGKKIAGYGAAAKGNTLLNYCGIKKDMVDFIVDASVYKQGKYTPASHIPVVSEDFLKIQKPDFVLVLPWNIKSEIIQQIGYIRDWGGQFVIPIPCLEII